MVVDGRPTILFESENVTLPAVSRALHDELIRGRASEMDLELARYDAPTRFVERLRGVLGPESPQAPRTLGDAHA